MVRIGNFFFHYRNGLFPLAFVLLLWQGRPIFANDLVAAGVGFGVAMIGQVLRAATIGLAYIIRGGKNRQVYAEDLVTGGLFSHCRNPLYVGNLLILAGVGLAANSLIFMVIGMPFFLFAYRAIIAAEENFLRGKFGQQFDDYCARVNRFLPSLAGLGATLGSMEFKWRRLLVKEYGSTFAWMCGALALVMKNLWWNGHYNFHSSLLRAMAGAMALLVLAYAVARYIKKNRLLLSDSQDGATSDRGWQRLLFFAEQQRVNTLTCCEGNSPKSSHLPFTPLRKPPGPSPQTPSTFLSSRA